MIKDKSRLKYSIFGVIIVIGIVLRFWGLDWGFPYLLHPDEGTIVNTAINMVRNNSFEPTVFYRPDHLIIKINTLIYQIFTTMILGQNIDEIVKNNVNIFYFIGRFVTQCFGLGSIYVGYLIGKKLKGNLKFIIPAFIALFPSYIENGHYVTPDVPITFFTLLIIYLAIVYIEKPDNKQVIYLSIAVAAGITIKYTMAIGCVLIALIVISSNAKKKDGIQIIIKQGIIAICVVSISIFVISPVLFTNASAVYKAIVNEARTSHLGADKLGFFGNMKFYIKEYVLQTKIILLFPCIYGFYKLYKKYTKYVIPILFGIIYMIVMSRVALHWERWALPMYVSPIIATSIGIEEAFVIIKSYFKKSNKLLIYPISLLSLIVLVSNILELVKVEMQFVMPNTRVISQSYCDSQGINVNNSIYEGYTTLRKTGPGTIFGEFLEEDNVILVNKSYANYILLSSQMYNRYYNEAERYKSECNIYNLLDSNYKLIKKYTPIVNRKSKFEIKSIYYDIKYIKDCINKGYVGDELKIYSIDNTQHVKYELGEEIDRKSYINYSNDFENRDDNKIISKNNTIVFKFYLQSIEKDLQVYTEIKKFNMDESEKTNAKVFINGQYCDDIVIGGRNNYKIDVSKEKINSTILELKFVLDDSDKIEFYNMRLE